MNQETLWDKKALDFPRYNKNEDAFQRQIIEILQKKEILNTNSNILDIGCGTGVFTIPMAKVAKKITALDISFSMLEILKKDSKIFGVEDKIIIEHSSLNKFDKKNKYDLVFGSLSAAFNEDIDYEKAVSLAKKYVCILDFENAKGLNFEEILNKKYNIKQRSFNNIKNLKQWLISKNISFNEIPLKRKIKRFISIETAINNIREIINTSKSNLILSNQEILNLLKPITKDQKVNFVLDSKLILVYWEKISK